MLDSENEMNDNESHFTPQCAGKKKASSPLDSDQTTKKQKEYDSPDASAAAQNSSHDSVCPPGTGELVSNI